MKIIIHYFLLFVALVATTGCDKDDNYYPAPEFEGDPTAEYIEANVDFDTQISQENSDPDTFYTYFCLCNASDHKIYFTLTFCPTKNDEFIDHMNGLVDPGKKYTNRFVTSNWSMDVPGLITTFSPLYSSSLKYSKIHYTSDGGQTWQTYGPYSPLNGVKTFYDGNGYAYGDYGVLLQLGNGFPVGQNTLPGASNQAVAWPNPATTGLQITLPSFAQCGAQLSISNGLGEVVRQQQVSGKVVNVAINGLPAGFYVYTLSNATQKATGKFVVK